jgi:HPt (histidine-containing phosphotransfer) domain-containing protein
MPSSNQNIIHLDLSNLRENSMGDETFIQEMIELFIKRGTETLVLLKSEITSESAELWVSYSHALKGMAANIGALYLRELCAHAQFMEDLSPALCQDIFNEISSEFAIVVKELGKTN